MLYTTKLQHTNELKHTDEETLILSIATRCTQRNVALGAWSLCLYTCTRSCQGCGQR